MPKQRPDETIVLAGLRGNGWEPSSLKPLAGGEWSLAYAFRDGDRDLVVRAGAYVEDFQKDRFAMRFASPDLPVPRVLEIGELPEGGHYAVSERVEAGSWLEDLEGAALDDALPAIGRMLAAMREADVSGTTGYGSWDVDGNAPRASWAEALARGGRRPGRPPARMARQARRLSDRRRALRRRVCRAGKSRSGCAGRAMPDPRRPPAPQRHRRRAAHRRRVRLGVRDVRRRCVRPGVAVLLVALASRLERGRRARAGPWHPRPGSADRHLRTSTSASRTWRTRRSRSAGTTSTRPHGGRSDCSDAPARSSLAFGSSPDATRRVVW